MTAGVTPATLAEPAVEECPLCGKPDVYRLVPGWNDGRRIPIAGCGNPWHYDGFPEPLDPLTVETTSEITVDDHGAGLLMGYVWWGVGGLCIGVIVGVTLAILLR